MIKFFRKIRQRFIGENRFNKYLFYAVGEIVLVVFGILIALWINDWNERRKDDLLEQKYLTAMLEDFDINLEISELTIDGIYEVLPQLVTLLEQSALEVPTISTDSLNVCFSTVMSMPAYFSTDRVYNNLMGSGDLKLIKSDVLKTYLAEYYGTIYVINLIQNTHELELVNSFQPYVMENMDFQAISFWDVEDFALPPAVNEGQILEVLKTQEFRNLVTLKWTILSDLLAQNESLEEISLDIHDELKALTGSDDQASSGAEIDA